MGVWEAGMVVTDDRLNTSINTASRKVFLTGTMNSTTYVDMAGNAGAATSVTITKYSATSDLWVAMKVNCFSDTASTMLRLGIRINGVDYDVALHYFTSASLYLPAIGWAAISGIPAGSFTCQSRWKRISGAGIINTLNTISELDLTVREVGL